MFSKKGDTKETVQLVDYLICLRKLKNGLEFSWRVSEELMMNTQKTALS